MIVSVNNITAKIGPSRTVGAKEQHLFDLAFELAYFIHVNKEVAFFIAEDALVDLPLMIGKQNRGRLPSDRLRGFWKWGERNRPVRKHVGFTELQMLQWLVYKHSEPWERQTERGEGPYLITEEDMIVRFIEYLAFISMRKGSFYVTLAVGPILHQFDRRETRLFYDVLTQSDSARMKDTNYIGKQRLEMLERLSRRFGYMLQTVIGAGCEKQFEMRSMTDEIQKLVNHSLKSFIPWQTSCVIDKGFEITDIMGLYYSENGTYDEDSIEMNRIHTVLDPKCFARFADGLAKYVRGLPDEDPDKGCVYEVPDQRYSIPQFFNFPYGSSRGDRFQPPERTEEDYIRLQRTLDGRLYRRRSFTPNELRI